MNTRRLFARILSAALVLAGCFFVLTACGKESGKGTPTPAESVQDTPTESLTPSATMPAATSTPEPTAEPSPTPTPVPTLDPNPPVLPEAYSDAELVKRIQEEVRNTSFAYRREEIRTEGEYFLLHNDNTLSNDKIYNRILSYYDENGKVKLERYLQDDTEVYRRLLGEDGLCLMWDGNAVLEGQVKEIYVGDKEHPSEKYETRGASVVQYTTYTYYENGSPKEVTEQEFPLEGTGFERKETKTVYDENGRILSVKESAQKQIERQLDRCILQADGVLSYDVTTLRFGKTAETVYEYDESGNLVNRIIRGDNDKEWKVSYTYEKDDQGRVSNIRAVNYLDGNRYEINAREYTFLYYSNGPVLLRNKIVNPAAEWSVIEEEGAVFLPGTEWQKKLETCSGLSCEELMNELSALTRAAESVGYNSTEAVLFTPNPYPVVKTFPKEEGRMLLGCFGDYSGLMELKEFPMNRMWDEQGYENITWFGGVYLFDGDLITRVISSNGTGSDLRIRYDSKKRFKTMTAASDGTIVWEYRYDSAGRISAAEKKSEYFYRGGGKGGYKLLYTYDGNGKLKKMTGELTAISYYESEKGTRTAMTVTIEPYTGNGEE